jgi:hypothetical protein
MLEGDFFFSHLERYWHNLTREEDIF